MVLRSRFSRFLSRGLTAVELTLTLGIIAVLAVIGLQVYQGWQDKAKTQTAQADIIELSLLIDDVFADTGELPDSLADIGKAGHRDPWGGAYVYVNLMTSKGNGKARKDKSLVPLNSDYDLYSKGPDGASATPLTAKASRDDILRANNGRFVGPASQY
ncbi:MAG: prepilin-type cleavage/methylation domain-containing protein [Rubrivivax sp.]|nr:prepilin-type cleavage/methylation domain-containing protein [Rubrivivax sp.]